MLIHLHTITFITITARNIIKVIFAVQRNIRNKENFSFLQTLPQ